MDDLTRFTLAWGVLIAILAAAVAARGVSRWLVAQLLALALRRLVRSRPH